MTDKSSQPSDIKRICPVCSDELKQYRVAWLYRCGGCSFIASTLDQTAPFATSDGSLTNQGTLSESHRQDAIKSLRLKNAQYILSVLAKFRALKGSTLCDIGCGYGWFLTVAGSLGVDAFGIEPEQTIASEAQIDGLNVRCGLFPDCVESGETFDIITFNDVLEHIPNVDACMAACFRHLNSGGYLSVVIPSSRGVFYRLSEMLSSVGIRAPFDRMWQKNFHSPHLSYFNDSNLEKLANRVGFTLESRQTLPSIEGHGLWNRLRMDKTSSMGTAILVWIGVQVMLPIINLLPADIIFHVYRKP